MSIRINRVYTRTGDSGETSLIGGVRVSKGHPRVCCYGDVDELNSVLACVKEEVSGPTVELKNLIEFIQQELFDLGAELATPHGYEYPGMRCFGDVEVENLERLCDFYRCDLDELNSFILPGGSRSSSFLHMARTVARRAERTLVIYLDELRAQGDSIHHEGAVRYLNRLSDLLFVLSRWVLLKEGKDSPVWHQCEQRQCPV